MSLPPYRGGLVDPSLVSPQVAFLPAGAQATRPEELSQRLGIDPEQIALLAANENPLGPSERAVEAAATAVREMHRYPDPEQRKLREALAHYHGVTPEHVFVGAGSTEIIELLVRTFAGPGQTVVGGWPTFAAYRIAAQVAGREFLTAPLSRGRLDLAGIAALVDLRTKLVFIANPNNPTGTHVGLRELVAFLNRLPPETIVVLDEAYADFVEARDYPASIRELLPGHPRLVVLRTFSKAHALAGLRVGYAVMAPPLVRYLELVRPAYAVSAVAEAAALAALEDLEHVERGRRLVFRERAQLLSSLRRLGLRPFPSQANFVCVGGLEGVCEHLERKGLLVRSLTGYGMPDAIRISVGAPEANLRLIEALEAFLEAREGGV
ncbi:MAG: histidinol-phosphate transaminase [Myxococcota bacterium]